MTVKMKRKNSGCTAEMLSELTEQVGRPLPGDYLSFLREQNGGRPEPNEFDVGADNGSGVLAFCSADEVVRQRNVLAGRLGEDSWPIADAEGGNAVCLQFLGRWSIVFWDHETEELTPLAPSFSDFYGQLRKFDPSSIQLKPGQVKSVWIDPELLKK